MIPAGLDATLVLVRHGESTYITERRFQGQADVPLTALGERQAGRVASRLARPHDRPALPIPTGLPREIIHSPLMRTTRTASAIHDAIGDAIEPATGDADGGAKVTLRPDAGFLEIGQGVWEGLHRDEIAARYAEVLAGWRRRPTEVWAPGGESVPEVAERVRSALARTLIALADGHPPGTLDRDHVAGYTAGISDQPWSIVVGHDGVFKVALLTLFDLALERFWMWSMDLAAITVVEFRAGRAVLRAHNLTEHLATLLDEAAMDAQEERSRSGAL